MKLMSDPDLTQKVMSKLGQVPQSSQGPPAPPAESQEAPEINNLFDAARYAVRQQTTWTQSLKNCLYVLGHLAVNRTFQHQTAKPTAVCDSHKQVVKTDLIERKMGFTLQSQCSYGNTIAFLLLSVRANLAEDPSYRLSSLSKAQTSEACVHLCFAIW